MLTCINKSTYTGKAGKQYNGAESLVRFEALNDIAGYIRF